MVRFSALLLTFAFSFACGCGGEVVDPNGDDSSAIIGGRADSGDPSVVALFAHQPGANRGSLCTATVISPTKLLTAAHCCAPSAIGAGNVFDAYAGPRFDNTARWLPVARCDYDPQFDINNLSAGHDIAVATLRNATTLAPIPYNPYALGASAVGAQLRLVGYGDNAHNTAGAGIKRQLVTTIDNVYDGFLHIGGSNQQTCHGDSGGPAFGIINGVEMIVGITSFGYDRSRNDVCYGGGYDTRVDRYTRFIQAHL